MLNPKIQTWIHVTDTSKSAHFRFLRSFIFLIYIYDETEENTKQTKQKHGACVELTLCTCYPKNSTEYAPLSHLFKLK